MSIWTDIGNGITSFVSSSQTLIIKLVLIIAAIVAIYIYWEHTQKELDSLSAQNAALSAANTANLSTIATLQADYKKSQQDLNTLNQKYAIIQTQENLYNSLNVSSVTEQTKISLEVQTNKQLNNIFTNLAIQTQPNLLTIPQKATKKK